MPFITSPSILSTKNSLGVIVVPVNRAIRFVGATVAMDGPAQTVVTVSAGTNTWNESGNVLTGGTPTTPNEFFGSNNDYDVIMNRNSIEIARMAASGFFVQGIVGVGATYVINLLVDPTAGAGIAAPTGSIGLRDNAGVGETWQKAGVANTAWTLLDSSATDEWLLAGNALSGGTPSTPTQRLGSTNDFDVISQRNSIEFTRLSTLGFFADVDTLQYLFASNSLRFGTEATTGVITASGDGSFAHGSSTAAGTIIRATSTGAYAFGVATSVGLISAAGSGAMAHGLADASGSIIQATSTGAHAFGHALTVGKITASGSGSHAFGRATASATIVSLSEGSFAHGSVDGVGSSIEAASIGCIAHGQALSLGIITASGIGSLAQGRATTSSFISAGGNGSIASGNALGSDSSINASGSGTFSMGVVTAGGDIDVSGTGGFAHGVANNSAQIRVTVDGGTAFGFIDGNGNASLIRASAAGATAFGYNTVVAGTSLIEASGNGSLAHGAVETNGSITSTAIGATAQGYAAATGAISATGEGGFASGHAATAGSNILATGNGSLALGRANGFTILASNFGSLAGGDASTAGITASGVATFCWGDGHVSSADYGTTFGFGNNNDSYSCLVIGRFADSTGFNANTWIDTDPVFIAGNGTGTGTRANGFRIDKDGRETTTASHVDTAIRTVAAASAISARTDYVVVCDSTGATGNLTLPAGEDGLEFVFTGAGAGIALYTLVANGGDAFDVNVITVIAAGVVTRIKFLGGTWYAV